MLPMILLLRSATRKKRMTIVIFRIDLAPFHLTEEFIQNIAAEIPVLPNALMQRYMNEYSLSEYDAHQLCDELATAIYFDAVIKCTKHYKAAANWILGPVKQWLHEHHQHIDHFNFAPEKIAELIDLVDAGKINFSIASSKIFHAMIGGDDRGALEIAESMNLIQVSDTHELAGWVQEVIAKMPDKVAEYKKGKKGLIGLFVGEIKKLSKGKADPKIVTALLEESLKN